MSQSIKISVCLFFLLFTWTCGYSQSGSEVFTHKNAVYIDAVNYYFSLNYDRTIYQKSFFKLNARVGFGLKPVSKNIRNELSVMGNDKKFNHALISEVSALLGRRKHHFETGLGYSYHNSVGYRKTIEYDIITEHSRIDYQSHKLFSRIGYRYQKPTGGFLFRAGFTPTIIGKRTSNPERFDNGYFFFNPGTSLSLGWSF